MRRPYRWLCAVGLVLAAGSAVAQTESTAGQHPLKSATLRGTKLAYVDVGRGTTVVFVHGALSDYRYWAAQLDAAADAFRVIAYSRRDFYPNSRGSDAALQTPDRDVADLIELIIALGVAPVHLVGHSAGGHAALVAAIRRPDLVRSLVLEEGGFVNDHPASMQVLAQMQPVIERSAQHRAAGAREAAVRNFIDFVSGEGFFDSASAPIKRLMLDNEPAMGLRANAPLTCAETESVVPPVLIILGERSPPHVSRLMTGLRECLRNEETVTISGASHGVHYEQPNAFNRAVFAFLAKH